MSVTNIFNISDQDIRFYEHKRSRWDREQFSQLYKMEEDNKKTSLFIFWASRYCQESTLSCLPKDLSLTILNIKYLFDDSEAKTLHKVILQKQKNLEDCISMHPRFIHNISCDMDFYAEKPPSIEFWKLPDSPADILFKEELTPHILSKKPKKKLKLTSCQIF